MGGRLAGVLGVELNDKDSAVARQSWLGWLYVLGEMRWAMQISSTSSQPPIRLTVSCALKWHACRSSWRRPGWSRPGRVRTRRPSAPVRNAHMLAGMLCGNCMATVAVRVLRCQLACMTCRSGMSCTSCRSSAGTHSELLAVLPCFH